MQFIYYTLYLQAFYEAQQGDGAAAKRAVQRKLARAATVRADQRRQFINGSNLRNDLQVFQFDPVSASFGKGGAQIANVEFLDADGAPLAWVVGGEEVTLRVTATTHAPLDAPIIGFVVKDRLGQALFGDNTYLSYAAEPLSCDAGEEIQADFRFAMPILPVGDYSINAAIASGTQEQHVQHHWMHDAVLFKSESTSASTGLVGIPMLDIGLSAYKAQI